ncbi:MAG: tRNA (guanosine(37)-N1)-methyltransferase TrmD [Phycisphaeraceae bacterium]|nr:tRNA (guanosine(37)-N1)-methyltransferase TrmD [Phycisphaerales bacterium]MCB9860249.1 tRNA (guanosine(37)-N1)-methyltransferase TrmD [Phycisphaeraceae bacterium]
MRVDVITTFPEMFSSEPPGALGISIPARAQQMGALSVHAHQLRDYTQDAHQTTDDRPFGGGPGMVMMCQPIWDAVQDIQQMDAIPAQLISMTPQGTPLTQQIVESLAQQPRIIVLAGHYEGIDERVIEKLQPMELSIGDYVLSGGELAAIVLIDAVARLLPGVLGHDESHARDSFSQVTARDAIGNELRPKLLKELGISEETRLLDCPHYTRPREWEGMPVPDVLLSGDHAAIAQWRLEEMVRRTKERRPELLD